MVAYNKYFNVYSGSIKSGKAFHRPMLTGQTTSYRDGDDYWHLVNNPYSDDPTNPEDIVKLVNFTTLFNNNIFGNTNRFTDENGLQLYGNDYVIDHYTGLGWYRVVYASGDTWETVIDKVHSISFLGYSDWKLPNINELSSIVNNISVRPLNYSPFNHNVQDQIMSSTTDERNTNNIFYISNSLASANLGPLIADKTLTTLEYMICRNHFYYNSIGTVKTSDGWVRNPNWMDFPSTLVPTDETLYVLVAVFEDDFNRITMRCDNTSALIEWGDGTTQVPSSYTVYNKVYDYSTISGSINVYKDGRNYKQVMIKVSGTNITGIVMYNNSGTINSGGACNSLDIYGSLPNVGIFQVSALLVHPYLERVRLISTSTSVNMFQAFSFCSQLQVFKIPDYSYVSNFYNCFFIVITVNGNPYNLGDTISMYDKLEINPDSIGFIKLNNTRL